MLWHNEVQRIIKAICPVPPNLTAEAYVALVAIGGHWVAYTPMAPAEQLQTEQLTLLDWNVLV